MIVMSLLRGIRPGLGVTNILKQETPFSRQIVRDLRTSVAKRGVGGDSPHFLQITASRFQWHQYKDQLHFYILLGVIPLSALVFWANVYIGPATLCEIPEDYVPKQWEYYRSPITRWLAQYYVLNIQEQYERNLHYVTVIEEKRRMRLLSWKVERLMQERGDYPNHFTSRPFTGKYVRNMQLERDLIDSVAGEF